MQMSFEIDFFMCHVGQEQMMQIHGLSTVLEDHGFAPPTYSYMAPKHFHFAKQRPLI